VSYTTKKEFVFGHWFVSGGNISDLYGSYQVNYLKRIETLFPDAEKVVHLFVGSLPPSNKYVRVGLPQGDSKPDIECDAHELSSHLPFKADVIYADPPYSKEDSEHYANCMVNRERVLEECALSLADNGMIVWMDQALPVFKNALLRYVGCISYIRSTGNRFRCVCLFQKVGKDEVVKEEFV
jgi:16S rRNA G966 N2-methylase RsmD